MIACICAFFLLVTARSFCTHQRSRLTKIVIFNTSFKKIDGSCSPLGVAARLHGKLCEKSLETHLHRLFLRKTRTTWATAFPRINSHTTTVTVLTATAPTTLVASCVFVLLGPTLITRRRRRVPSQKSTSPSSSARASFVSSVKAHLTTLPPRASS